MLGAGAVGAYYGGQLARAGHDVSFLARGPNLDALRARGVEIRTPGGVFRAPVAASDRIDDLAPADCAILAVKSYSLDEIAPVVRTVAEQGSAILPFLNGIETAERLVEHGVPAAALLGGLTQISVVRAEPGVVEQRSPFQIVVLGELDGSATSRVAGICAAFAEAGVDARVSLEIRLDLWRKFDFIVTLAAACGLARLPVGELRDDRLGRRLLERAAREVVEVARARGVIFPTDEAARVMALVDSLPAPMKPSFLVDLESGGPTELDIQSGAVSRFAEQLGIATPVHDTAALVLRSR